MRKGQKMSPEQYQALRRKVGGTAKDYWKGWVDVKGSYVDKVSGEERERGNVSFFNLSFFLLLSSPPFFTPRSPRFSSPFFSLPPPIQKGYVSDEDDAVSAPPGILFLVLTLVGLGAATAAVVSKVG